ncbi:amidohydrolase family protein [Microvirga antarctica]|uniref:amidohydrolase family protein n=1 Tax=Microvirga antarctica TaxID=2819233 RepID=UPI001B307F28|nr:amidohydrolase family protein [Microvirga antarctica]
MTFGIVDIHCHIFPPLAGASGFPDVETHRLHQQRSMHVHGNQPYRRLKDDSVIQNRPLWNAEDPSEAGRNANAGFKVGRCGRFEWSADGEDGYVQFLPPYMADMSAPAEIIVRQMDYAGIATAVLQNEHIYGNLAEDFASARAQYPGRFIGLAQVEESFADRDAELARVADELDRLDMAGLYYTTTGLFRDGYRRLPDDPSFGPLWREMARRDVPIFWVHSAKSPIGTYEDEMRHLARIVERHPTLRHVLVHGIPTALYAREDGTLDLPDVLTRLLTEGPVSAEILYPIGWGGRMAYPYTAVLPHVRQLVETFGADRFMWGSDMPNVERYCTYRQSLAYLWDHADFLNEQERRLIFRDNALRLFSPTDL